MANLYTISELRSCKRPVKLQQLVYDGESSELTWRRILCRAQQTGEPGLRELPVGSLPLAKDEMIITGDKERHSLTLDRRKKSRCSGEKPRCSLCGRLRQRCIYADRGPPSDKGVRGRGRGRDRDRNSRPTCALVQGQSEVSALSAY